MPAPELSVIVYARNSASGVGKTLESIQVQSFQAWECIVVDDGSSDHTGEVVRSMLARDGRFTLVQQSYGGMARAKNRGFLESTPAANFVAFMDAGDVWDSNAARNLIGSLEQTPGAVGACGLEVYGAQEGAAPEGDDQVPVRGPRFGFKGGRIVEWPALGPCTFETLVWTESAPLFGALVVRRTGYEAAGLFDPSLVRWFEWDMAIRLVRSGPIQMLGTVVLRRPAGLASWRAPKPHLREESRRVERKAYFSADNSQEQSAMLKAGWRLWQRKEIKKKWNQAIASFSNGTFASAMTAGGAIPSHILDYIFGRPVDFDL